MEDIISEITKIYQKEKENKKDAPKQDNNQNLIDKIYVIHNKKSEISKISSNEKKKDSLFDFNEGINEKEMTEFLAKHDIPNKYLNKTLKQIFKILSSDNSKKKRDSKPKLLFAFLDKNKNKLQEKHIIYIFNHIKEYNQNIIDEIIRYIIINIKIDNKYFLNLLKEDEIILNKNIIHSLNNFMEVINSDDKINFINLIKSLNLIHLMKEIITKEEYNDYNEKIENYFNELLNKEENNIELCEKEFNEDFNIEFINRMKIINSNPNKAYFIQEQISI